MSTLDDLLSAAIAEGQAAIAEKKKPKVSVQEKRRIASELLTKQVQHVVPVVARGVFEVTCLVAEYVRRTCKTCNHSELCAVPRVFLCEQQVDVPSTRRLHRLNNQETVHGYIKRGLPVKTEVYSSPAPFCKHCVKELIDATRKTTEGSDQDTALHPEGSVLRDVHDLPGAVQVSASPGVPARSDYEVHHLADREGYQPSEAVPRSHSLVCIEG